MFRRKVEEEKPEYIGEYYRGYWVKFTNGRVQDEVDGYIKINGYF